MTRRSALRQLPRICTGSILLMILLLNSAFASACPSPTGKEPESAGFVMELPAAESEVLQAVASVAGDTIVRGTYVYDREKTLTGAMPADSSDFFGTWGESGRVFYKVLTGALAPRNFKDSNDVGAITVRYVVQPVNEGRTRLRIDAIFVEDGRRKAHPSNGSVESSEFREIQDRVNKIQLSKQETAAAVKKGQEEEAKADLLRQRADEGAKLSVAESSARNLEQRLQDLRHDVELRVKGPDTELKSAPFHSATKLELLAAGAEVVVMVITPYWYGVETADGHRGWLRRDQVEPLP